MRPDFKSIAIELLLVAGILIFAKGFLPPTRTKLGFSTEIPDVPRQFNRMVFMVVDAMRSDFMFSENSKMKSVHRLLNEGHGYAFTAFSEPPTVTLPRLKGITTGSPPNFLDAVINIAESDSASTLQNMDSWVFQLHNQSKSIYMFGDNTWLKLFPNTFTKEEGTDSFYVADFTEVDYNVTRHLSSELKSDEWDVLILHYLGLDHIGHKGGPNSPHMKDKQIEMDSVVSQIYDSLNDETLLVVLGDHGMNDVGNHGGASSGETSAALGFFSKTFNKPVSAPLKMNDDYTYYDRIFQVDIVPSLAMLLGFPIPKNSLGVFIEQFLPLWSTEEQQKIMEYNCDHLGISGSCTYENLKETQEYLKRTSSEHIMGYMYAGIAVIVLATCLSIAQSFKFVSGNCPRGFLWVWWLVIPIAYIICLTGSSTVEEEHYFWYWVLTGILCHTFIVYEAKVSIAIMLACLRVIRGWNSAGQKWVSTIDVAKILAHYPWVITTSLAVSLILIALLLVKPSKKEITAYIAVFLFKYGVTLYPLNSTLMIFTARAAYLISLFNSAFNPSGIVCIFIMQTKTINVPLWIFLIIGSRQLQILLKKSTDPVTCTLIVLCFEFACFYAFGGSNSLATVDLSNAYNGVSGYNIPLVALLTYLGNWAPSLYWTLISLPPKSRSLKTLFYCASCVGATIACLMLREHLFIWTVFSPKLLYVGAWLVFHELIMSSLVLGVSYTRSILGTVSPQVSPTISPQMSKSLCLPV